MSGTIENNKIESVWNKGIVVEGYDKTLFRKDCCGAWISKLEYGKQSPYGWEVDHVYPQIKGGGDELDNLRPMHWANNRSKSDDYPNYDSSVCAEENRNVNKAGHFSVNDRLQKKLSQLYNI